MTAKRVITAEICPLCASLDVQAIEPRWFDIEVERRREWDPPVYVEFGCRDCGTHWE